MEKRYGTIPAGWYRIFFDVLSRKLHFDTAEGLKPLAETRSGDADERGVYVPGALRRDRSFIADLHQYAEVEAGCGCRCV